MGEIGDYLATLLIGEDNMAKSSGGTRATVQSAGGAREQNASNADRLKKTLASGGIRGVSVTMTRSTTIVKTRGQSQAEKTASYLRRGGWSNVTVRKTSQFSRNGRDDIYGKYTDVWVASGFNPGIR